MGVAVWRGVTVVVAAVVVVVLAGKVEGQQRGEGCQSQRTCSECIQTSECMWCSNPKSPEVARDTERQVVHHCQHQSVSLTSFCDLADLQNPTNYAEVTENKPLTVIDGENKRTNNQTVRDIIQISPQRMKLRLRKGMTQTLNITYRLATDYPVDLYYLMDLSNSMKDDKERLAGLGSQLASLLNNLTEQYRLGFGSFVDKVLMPYADTSPIKLLTPCVGCSRPYSFRNDLPLDIDHRLFTARVKGASISGNLDAPEGGFDALMQAMVCPQVGWRPNARRILIFSTDARFHHAGDGRLAGIITPNDETCHLNEANEYTAYDQYDYPSIAQINKVANEQNINIIFAVSNHEELYKELSDSVKTSSFGKLDRDSANVVDLVREQYEKISSTVKLSDNSSRAMSVIYRSRCKGDGPLVNTSECQGVKNSDTIEFTLQVTANECPSDGAKTYVEVKTLQESLILEIEFQCSCGCNTTALNVARAPECGQKGTLVCGVCDCDAGYRGESCQCSNEYSDSSERDKALCKASLDEPECSGRGYCSCGTCVCHDKDVHGTYCQCNRRKCLSGVGSECSGHGSCQCNKCACHHGYVGDLCECPDDNVCIASGSMKVCSGHGQCVCGKCRCQQEQGISYSGRYCSECRTCTGRCLEFRDCVQCHHFQSGPLSGDPCNTCNISSHIMDSLDGQVKAGANLCIFEDEEGCYFNFTYQYNPTALDTGRHLYNIYVQRERQCPPPPPVLGIVFGLIASIVAIGLITLIIWKTFTTIHDRREYARFEQERQAARWNAEENPLYKGAQTTFQNPAFANQQSK